MLRTIFRAVRLIASRPGRAILILRMAFWVTVLSLAVRRYSLPRALQIVAAPSAGRSSAGADGDEDLATAIDALLGLKVLVFKPVCWKRAAILQRYLTLRGRATTINFGVRRGDGGKLDGHAWVESAGIPILESEHPDYTVTYVFPSSAPFEIELASLANTGRI
jgi:hypothetical protein